MREGFHTHDGWYFRRDDDQVVIEVAESAQEDAPLLASVTLDADSWASAVASVSAGGGTSDTFHAAQLLHMGRPTDHGMSFAAALAALHRGQRVARAGWNGRGVWLVLVPGSTITVAAGRPLGEAAPELVGQAVEYRPHIDIRTVDGEIVPWVASQTDLLAEDWAVVS